MDKTQMFVGIGEAELIARSNYVQRWHLTPTSIVQTVAAHHACVASLMHGLPFDLSPENRAVAVRWALVHDLPEVLTGDYPSHIKQAYPELKALLHRIEGEIMPEWWVNDRAAFEALPGVIKRMVKACDLADTLRMARYITNPAMRNWVEVSLGASFNAVTEGMPYEVVGYLNGYRFSG